jgi:hypothetical protein
MVIVEQSAETRATGDLAICPVVIRRTDVPDELATDALVKPLGHVVLDEFLDQGIGYVDGGIPRKTGLVFPGYRG